MTERKICEKGFTEGVGKFESVWVPLDPQPCCENCIYFDCCPILIASHEYIATNRFYCSDWQVKE